MRSGAQASSMCDPNDSLLLVVDVQERLVAPIPSASLERMLRGLGLVLDAAVLLGVPVVMSEQYPQGLGPTLDRVARRLPRETSVIDKTCFSLAGAEQFQTLPAD